MKKLILIITLLLTASILLSCGGGNGGTTPPKDEQPADKAITITEGFKILYGDDGFSLGATQLYAENLKNGLGLNVKVSSYKQAEDGEQEILIGMTDRTISTEADDMLRAGLRAGTHSFVIIARNGSCAVAASSYKGLRYALSVLYNDYGNEIPASVNRYEYVTDGDYTKYELEAKSYTKDELDAMAAINTVNYNGGEMADFDPAVLSYDIELGRTEPYPTIKFFVPEGVDINVTEATDSSRTTVVKLTAPNGKATRTYRFNFTKSEYDVMTDAKIEKVYGGAATAVAIIHDDGNVATGEYLKEQFVKNDLRGTLGLIGKSLITNKNGTDIGTTQVDFNNIKIKTDTVAFWQSLLDTGCFDVASHTMTHTFWGLTDEAESGVYKNSSGNPVNYSFPAGQITYEVAGSKQLLEMLFPGQTVKTLIKAGFGRHENGIQISDKAYEIIKENYIAMRNSSGGMETVPISNVYYMNCYQAAQTDTASTYINLVNTAAVKGGMQIFLFHKIEATPSSSLTAPQAATTEFFEWLGGEVKSGRVWSAFYEDLVMYAEEYKTAKVSAKNYGNRITVELTDELDNELYCHPLTVKVPVETDSEVLVVMRGTDRDFVNVMEDTNGKYVYLNLVPDSGKVDLFVQ